MGGGSSVDCGEVRRFVPDMVKLRGMFEEMDCFVKMQNLLFVLTPESLPGTAAALSEYVMEKGKAKALVNMILLTVRWRPKLEDLCVQLFKALCGRNGEVLQEILLSNLAPIPFNSFDPVISWSHLRFIRKCLVDGSIEKHGLLKRIHSFLTGFPEFRFANLMLFVFFAPEIYACDEDLYCAMIEIMKTLKHDQSKHIESLFLEYYEKLDEYIRDEWRSVAHEMAFGYPKDSIAWVLKEDDVDALQGMISEEWFDINQRIAPHLFAQYPDVQHRPTLCQFAAYFGSLKCFELLMAHSPDLSLRDEQSPSLSLAQFAVAGGNPDIISLLESKQCSFKACLQISGRFHRNEMLGNFQGQSILDCDPDFATFAHQCALSNNICGLAEAYREGCDIDECDQMNRTPLHYACFTCSAEFVHVLSRTEGVNFDMLDGVSFWFMILFLH